MKTTSYSPSQLEIEIANALMQLKDELQNKLSGNTIDSIIAHTNLDNPSVKISVTDGDGDPHEVVIKVVQLIDKM